MTLTKIHGSRAGLGEATAAVGRDGGWTWRGPGSGIPAPENSPPGPPPSSTSEASCSLASGGRTGPRLTTGLAVPPRPEAAALGALCLREAPVGDLTPAPQPVRGRSLPGACPALAHLPPQPWQRDPGAALGVGRASTLACRAGFLPPCLGCHSAGDRPPPLTVPRPLLPPRSHTQPCAQERYKSGRWTLQRRAGRWRLLGRPLQEPLQPGGGAAKTQRGPGCPASARKAPITALGPQRS